MPILDENVRNELGKLFDSMTFNEDVKMIFFKQSLNCETCSIVEELLKELSSFSNRIKLEIYNRTVDEKKAKEYGVDMVPAIFIETSKSGKRVVFYGTPSGYEFISLIEAIKNSQGIIDFDKKDIDDIKAIDKDVNIKVFVTPTCPYCPSAVITAHKMAILNEKIKSVMIEAGEFYDYSNLYNVSGVPKIVINDNIHLVGAQPAGELIKAINSL